MRTQAVNWGRIHCIIDFAVWGIFTNNSTNSEASHHNAFVVEADHRSSILAGNASDTL